MRSEFEAIYRLVAEATKVVITTHMSPDGDAMGSALAMYHWLHARRPDMQSLTVVLPTAAPDFLMWLPDADKCLVHDRQHEEAEERVAEADLIICTDFNEPKRVGALAPALLNATCKKVLIDHHLHPSDFADVIVSVPEAPATCQLIYELITAENAGGVPTMSRAGSMQVARSGVLSAEKKSPFKGDLEGLIPTCIYTGLMTDTGNFSYNSRNPELYRIVATLIEWGVDKDAIYNNVFNQYSVDRMRLVGYCLNQKMRVFPEHHMALIYLNRKELYKYNFQSGDAEGIVNMPLQSKDIYYSCFMREDKATPEEQAAHNGCKTKIKISLRSQGDRPVNILAAELFGGGGHANASGGEYYGPLSSAVQRFLSGYTQFFKKD
ncbi:MAG: DHH family phosphoesterase [Paludibacteraceae bacterium]|nr:DHH family phosphoesterase [Paludibacteraceae bacterium]